MSLLTHSEFYSVLSWFLSVETAELQVENAEARSKDYWVESQEAAKLVF